MSQCVPQCERDGGLPRYPHIHHCSMIQDGMSDYVVSELTWEKGHLARHGLHTHPVPKHPTFPGATSSEKPLPSGTLEALVDQVTNPGAPNPAGCHLVPWLGAPASPFPAPDALVPSAKPRPRPGQAPRPGHVLPNPSATTGTGGSRAGSCSGRKRARVGAGDGDRSATGSVASIALAFNGDEAGFATSAASPPDGSPGTENTSCGRPASFSEEEEDEDSDDSDDDDSDEEGKSKNEKVTSHVSTKRNRTAAIHNQSERKRRDRINQRMRTLQKLVPNSSKTDKASILDEVIGYMKQLQAQVQMMNSMNRVPHMVMPMAMQQLQVAMMAQMAQMAQVGMATGMMGVRTLGGGGVRQPAVPWGAFFPPLLPADIPGRDQLQAPGGALLPDLSTAFMPCQTHPMAVDAYRSMAALYQQLYQLPPGS